MLSTKRRCRWWPVALASGLMFASATSAAASAPPVTIGVFGDSVVEGYTIPNYLHDGLVPQLRLAVARAGGFERGAVGFIPVNPFRWKFNDYTLNGLDAPRANAWVLSGESANAIDGLSGYSAIPLSARSTATTPIDAPRVTILFTSFPGGGILTVTAGAATFKIDTRSDGPPTAAQHEITVPAHAHTLTVRGTDSGGVIFNGVIDRRVASRGRVDIEIENFGHQGHLSAATQRHGSSPHYANSTPTSPSFSTPTAGSISRPRKPATTTRRPTPPNCARGSGLPVTTAEAASSPTRPPLPPRRRPIRRDRPPARPGARMRLHQRAQPPLEPSDRGKHRDDTDRRGPPHRLRISADDACARPGGGQVDTPASPNHEGVIAHRTSPR